MTVVATDASDGGCIGWATPNYPGFTTMSPGDGAVERVTRDAHAQGLRVLARFDVSQDVNPAKVYPRAVIGGAAAWVDPACPEVRAYELAKLKDLLTRVDVDEIDIDHVRYPGTDEVPASASLSCTGSTLGDTYHKDRNEVIASWVKEAAAAARAIRPDVVVSASVFGGTMSGPMANIGQDAARLAPHLDVLRPMLYLSYFSSTAAGKPHATVKDATAKGVAKFGADEIQPWIQGFDGYSTSTWGLCEQFKGLRDGGATDGLVWWFPSTGTAISFWTSVAACVPASAPSPSPAPAPSTFTATFAPKPGNSWWVETLVTSASGIAGVTASVHGGAPVALPKTSWGSYAKSFYVPAGSKVVLTATANDGQKVTSASYSWP